jgi:hypothetical protein
MGQADDQRPCALTGFRLSAAARSQRELRSALTNRVRYHSGSTAPGRAGRSRAPGRPDIRRADDLDERHAARQADAARRGPGALARVRARAVHRRRDGRRFLPATASARPLDSGGGVGEAGRAGVVLGWLRAADGSARDVAPSRQLSGSGEGTVRRARRAPGAATVRCARQPVRFSSSPLVIDYRSWPGSGRPGLARRVLAAVVLVAVTDGTADASAGGKAIVRRRRRRRLKASSERRAIRLGPSSTSRTSSSRASARAREGQKGPNGAGARGRCGAFSIPDSPATLVHEPRSRRSS